MQQYNFGVQRELGGNMMLEVRYVGSKGNELLEARAFNQGYDLNSPETPDYIFERFNQAYVAAGSPNGALNAGATARERGVGTGVRLPEHQRSAAWLDYNLANAAGAVIGFEARGPILGFNIPEAVLLANTGPLALQLAAAQPARSACRDGVQFNLAVHLLALEGHQLGRSREHGRRRQA